MTGKGIQFQLLGKIDDVQRTYDVKLENREHLYEVEELEEEGVTIIL